VVAIIHAEAVLHSHITLNPNRAFIFLAALLNSLATALSVTIVTFEKDCDAKTRRTMGEFYGMFPAQRFKKVVAFSSLVSFSLCQIFAKVLSTVLLQTMSSNLMLAVLLGEGVVFLVYKLARNDFYYWLILSSVHVTRLFSILIR